MDMHFVRIGRHEFRCGSKSDAIEFAQAEHKGAGYTIKNMDGNICIAHSPWSYPNERQMMSHIKYCQKKGTLTEKMLQDIYRIYDKYKDVR